MPEFVRRVPAGDTIERSVCPDCGHVDYQNPKVVVGSVVVRAGQVLLCRRAIEPRRGFWTLPAGYMELGETLEEGARREAAEEALADITLEGVLGLYDISRLSQVQVLFRARFTNPEASPLFGAGTESLEVRLFDWTDIPWDEIAFPSVRWALDEWRRLGDGALGAPARNPTGSGPTGSGPTGSGRTGSGP